MTSAPIYRNNIAQQPRAVESPTSDCRDCARRRRTDRYALILQGAILAIGETAPNKEAGTALRGVDAFKVFGDLAAVNA
jgi:hypothetical protein